MSTFQEFLTLNHKTSLFPGRSHVPAQWLLINPTHGTNKDPNPLKVSPTPREHQYPQEAPNPQGAQQEVPNPRGLQNPKPQPCPFLCLSISCVPRASILLSKFRSSWSKFVWALTEPGPVGHWGHLCDVSVSAPPGSTPALPAAELATWFLAIVFLQHRVAFLKLGIAFLKRNLIFTLGN